MFAIIRTTGTLSMLFTLLIPLTYPSTVFAYTPDPSCCTPNTKYPN